MGDDSDDSDSASDDEDGDGEAELLDSDEDEIDENGAQYLEKLEKSIHNKSNGTIEASIEDDSDGDDETSLESYTTPLDDEDTSVDEYQVFKEVMQQLEASQVEWYTRLVAPLSENDKKSLQEVFTLANQRRNARESKNIEQAGGYQFNQQTVPGQFNFATNAGHNFSFGN